MKSRRPEDLLTILDRHERELVKLRAALARSSGTAGVLDHGLLLGLTPDDDHPQYHTDARGDARYSLLAHQHVEADITNLHTRYLDSEAVTAMGVKGDANPLHHDRYTDGEAAAASAGLYLPIGGGTLTGWLAITDTDEALKLEGSTGNAVYMSFHREAAGRTAYVGHGLASSDRLYVIADFGDVYIQAKNAASTSSDVLLSANDGLGIHRNRIYVDGDGATTLYGRTGSGIIDINFNEALMLAGLNMNDKTLYAPKDPTLGSHVGDRDYNDTRYAQGDLGDYLPLAGGNMGGALISALGTSALPALGVGSSTTGFYRFAADILSVSIAAIGRYHFHGAGVDSGYFTGAGANAAAFKTADSAVGSPSFAWRSDKNTGLHRPIADHVALVAGGTQVLLADATSVEVTGVLGGSITDPTDDSHVGDRGYNDGRYAPSGGGGDHGALTGRDDDDHTLYVLADGTRAMLATGGGETLKLESGAAQTLFLALYQGATRTGYFGHAGTSNSNLSIIADDGSVSINAQRASAAAADVLFLADDATGTAKLRVAVDGDGATTFYDDAGASVLALDTGDIDAGSAVITAGGVESSAGLNLWALNGSLSLQARNSGAAASNVSIGTDDATGTIRSRLLFDGDGDTVFYGNDGAQDMTLSATELTLNAVDLDMLGNTILAPADPTAGTHVGDRDYNDARYILQGEGGYASITSTQGSITTVTDITGLSVTWTAIAGHRYKLTACLRMGYTGTGTVTGRITDSSNTSIAGKVMNATGENPMTITAVIEPSAGSTTYKVRAESSATAGNVYASSTAPSWFIVEDMG